MSFWTSKYAIMRDLSKVQGRVVPVDMNSAIGVAVAANERPPQVATEETEEDFYKMFACGDVDYSAAPDFGLIQHMLEMVRGGNESDSSTEGDVFEISKINAPSLVTAPLNVKTKMKPTDAKPKLSKAKQKSTQAVTQSSKAEAKVNLSAKPELTEDKTKPESDMPVKKKRQRNAAVISLLAALEAKENNNNESIKLLKPTDFISSKAVTESVKKVDEWFTNKEAVAPTQAKHFPSLTPVPMFKKKSVEKAVNKNGNDSRPQNSPSKSTETYKPSLRANEYYQKYLEKSQLNDCIKEDIWQKAERLMKEADAKRAAKAALESQEESGLTPEQVLQESSSSDNTNDSPFEGESGTKWDIVALSEPRHTNTGDEGCVICAAVRNHGYNIDVNVTVQTEKFSLNAINSTDCELD